MPRECGLRAPSYEILVLGQVEHWGAENVAGDVDEEGEQGLERLRCCSVVGRIQH